MNSASINYYNDIKRWCSSVKTELSRIYDDLQENAPYLRSIDASYRNNVQFLVNGLNEFLKKFDGSGSSYADKCISYITLSDSSTKYQGNGSKSDVSKGVSTLKSGVSGLSMSSSDRMKLVEKAAKSSPQNAAGSDPKSLIFLSNITSGFKYNSKFLGDVLADYYAVYEQSGKIRGENGKDIGSSDYIKNHETKAFGSSVCSDIVSSKQYVANILKALDTIYKSIVKDKSRLEEKVNYISAQNMANLKLAEENLEKCGAEKPSIGYSVPEWQLVSTHSFDEEFYATAYMIFKNYIVAYLFRSKHCFIGGTVASLDGLSDDEGFVNDIATKYFRQDQSIYSYKEVVYVYANSFQLNRYKYVTEIYINEEFYERFEYN